MILFPCNNSICQIKEYCLAYFLNCDAQESRCKTYLPRTVEDNRIVCDNYISPLRIYNEKQIIKNNKDKENE